MTRTITLDDIATRVDELYGPVHIPLSDGSYAKLLPMLRLSKAERAEFAAKQAEMNRLQDISEGKASEPDGENAPDSQPSKVEELTEEQAEKLQEEILEILRDLFRIVGRRTVYIEKLLEHFGDDFATLMTTFQMYAKETQAGEASASPSS